LRNSSLTNDQTADIQGGLRVKTCSACKTTLPRSEFHKSTKAPDGLLTHCKQCARASALPGRTKPRIAIPAAKSTTACVAALPVDLVHPGVMLRRPTGVIGRVLLGGCQLQDCI